MVINVNRFDMISDMKLVITQNQKQIIVITLVINTADV